MSLHHFNNSRAKHTLLKTYRLNKTSRESNEHRIEIGWMKIVKGAKSLERVYSRDQRRACGVRATRAERGAERAHGRHLPQAA